MPPTFNVRELARSEVLQFIAERHVGRLAYTHQGRVDIVPVHYVGGGDWLYGRTSLGAKVVALRHNQWVAFEVDEVRGPLDWTSVVIHGSFHVLDPEGGEHERQSHQRALEAVRTIQPWAFTDEDPLPERSILFGIHVDEVTGREGRSTR